MTLPKSSCSFYESHVGLLGLDGLIMHLLDWELYPVEYVLEHLAPSEKRVFKVIKIWQKRGDKNEDLYYAAFVRIKDPKLAFKICKGMTFSTEVVRPLLDLIKDKAQLRYLALKSQTHFDAIEKLDEKVRVELAEKLVVKAEPGTREWDVLRELLEVISDQDWVKEFCAEHGLKW